MFNLEFLTNWRDNLVEDLTDPKYSKAYLQGSIDILNSLIEGLTTSSTQTLESSSHEISDSL